MEVKEVIKKVNGKYFVYSEDGSKKLGGPYESRGEAVKRLQQVEHFKESNNLIWEAQELNTEIIEREGKPKVLKLKGTAITEGVSKNGVKYSYKNLKQNDGQMFNFLVAHRDDYDNPDHNVGEGVYSLGSSKLNFEGEVTNNVHHQDIVEQIQKNLVSVSVQGKADIKKEGNTVIVESLNIPLLCLVNKHARGIEGATIESAIEERLSVDGTKDDTGKQDKIMEANEMSDENAKEIVEKQLKEKDEMLAESQKKLKEAEDKLADAKKLEDAKKKKALEDEAKKKDKVVESITSMNKELKKEVLMEKSLSEVQIIESYEKKIHEAEGKGVGASEVDDATGKPDGENVEEALKGIIVEKDSGFITMDENTRKKFNEDLMNSVYNK